MLLLSESLEMFGIFLLLLSLALLFSNKDKLHSILFYIGLALILIAVILEEIV